MSKVKERFEWLEAAQQGLRMVLDDDIDPSFRIRPTVDPIRFIISIGLRFPLVKEARAPMRAFIRHCAREGDCEVPIINITKNRIQAEVLTKHRYRARDAKGKFMKQRFGAK